MLAAACLVCLIPATAAAGYYALLTRLARRPAALPATPTHALAVVIPAHDEAAALPATLAAVAACDYPAGRVAVWVVADNCADRTAEVARRAGVRVVERADAGRVGKGFALADTLPAVLATNPDAVLILDADCELGRGALRAIDAELAAGAEVVQAAVRGRNPDDGPAAFAAAVGAELDCLVAAGRDRVGRRVPLRGTGMTFRHAVLARHPWASVGLTEDAEYADRLRRAGVRVRVAAGAEVRSESPADPTTLARQRRRWRAALFVGPGLLTHWIDSKPLVLAQLGLTAAVVAAAGFGGLSPALAAAFGVWVAALLLTTAGVYVRAVRRVGWSWHRLGLFAAGPVVAARLLAVTVGAAGRPATWERTRRPAEPAR